MNNFLSPESKFARGFTTLVDIVILGILWIFTSIPVLTIGASSAAMYYAIHKTIFQGRGYAFQDYFRGFKENFKQGTVTTLIFLVYNGLLFYLLRSTTIQNPDKVVSWNFILVILMAFSIIWAAMLFAFMSRFSNDLKTNVKNSLLILVANLPAAVGSFFVLVCFGLILSYISKLVIILPGFLGVILHQIYEKVFRKYMSEEDKALEDERMMVNKAEGKPSDSSSKK